MKKDGLDELRRLAAERPGVERETWRQNHRCLATQARTRVISDASIFIDEDPARHSQGPSTALPRAAELERLAEDPESVPR